MKLELMNIAKEIKNQIIFQSVNIQMESGHIYGFVGTNGCGKTMLMKIILGLVKPSEGKILVNEQVFDRNNNQLFYPGAIIEKPDFFNHMTAIENLELLSSINKRIDASTCEQYLDKVGLMDVKNKKVGEYSLGMKQRLAIAQALMENPDIIVLDEPTNALDEKGIQMLYQLLKEEKDKNKLIIISSHHKEDIIQLTDIVYKFYDKKVVLSD